MRGGAKLAVVLLGIGCELRVAAPPAAPIAPAPPAAPTGPICDGTADDTAALQRALDRGGRVTLPAGRVCRFTRLTITAPVELALTGATLRVADHAPPGPFVRVTADHVAIRGGTIDGAGAHGWLVDWHGADGALEAVTLENGDSIGLSVTDDRSLVVARKTVARGFAGKLGIGFRVGAGALIADDCGAEANGYAGFFVSQTAAPATVIDGWTARNGVGVAIEGQRGGRVGHLRSHDDDRFGLVLDHGASDWHVGTVRVEDPGLTVRNRSATGVELFAHNQRNTFDDVVVIRAAGYGLAIAGGSSDNQLARVELDGRGAWDSDPGFVIAGGSSHNRVDSIRVLGHTTGVRIGENDLATDAPSNGNHLGTVYVEGAHYNAIRFERGHDNAIDTATIADSDSSGSDAQGFKGQVYFGNDSSRNRIGTLVQADDRRIPNYVIYAGPCAVKTCVKGAVPVDNHVDHVTARSWSVEVSHGVTPPRADR